MEFRIPGDLNAFYWNQIYALDYVVVKNLSNLIHVHVFIGVIGKQCRHKSDI